MASSRVRAGFPSPAADYLEKRVDLNQVLIQHPSSTFLFAVRGDSMVGAGICDGATLVVDRSLEARDGDVVIAVVSGDLTVKRLRKKKDGAWLMAENAKYEPIAVSSEDTVWGVVTDAINSMRKRR